MSLSNLFNENALRVIPCYPVFLTNTGCWLFLGVVPPYLFTLLRYTKEKPKSYTNENPEFIMEGNQFHDKFQKALHKLSEEQRITFLLSKADRKPHKEIAELLGVNKRVVDSRVYNASLKLKAELEEFNKFYAKKRSKLL